LRAGFTPFRAAPEHNNLGARSRQTLREGAAQNTRAADYDRDILRKIKD
jgi:hypothetical protein